MFNNYNFNLLHQINPLQIYFEMNEAKMDEIYEINKKFCLAIENEDFEAVQDSIRKGGQLYARIDYRKLFMPWSWLYSCNSIQILSCLLSLKDCNVNYPIQEFEDQTLIFGAIMNCNSEKIKILVQNGANVNAIDNLNHTPLSFALTFKDDECMNLVPLLLDLGADVSIGNNPLKVIEENQPSSMKMKKFCEYLVEFLDRIKEEKTLKDLKLAFSQIQELIKGYNVLDFLTEELDDIELMFSFEEKMNQKAHSEIQQLIESWSTTFGQDDSTKVKEEKTATSPEEEKVHSEDQMQQNLKESKSERPDDDKDQKEKGKNKITVALEKLERSRHLDLDQDPYFDKHFSQDDSEQKIKKKPYPFKPKFSNKLKRMRKASNTIKGKESDYDLVFEILTLEYDLANKTKGMIKLSDIPYEGELFENTIEEFGDIFLFHLFVEMINHPNSAFSKDWTTFLKVARFDREETPYFVAIQIFIERYPSMFQLSEEL